MPATFAGRYLLENAISTGAVSVLWRARDQSTGAPVALKFFPPRLVEAPPDLRTAQEMVAELRLVRHPHVACAHDVVVTGRFAAFVAPWIEGPTFRQMREARPGRHFEVADLRRWLRELLATLEMVHGKGVVHGSLDPDLVMQNAGEVFVVGWGVNAWLRQTAVRLGQRTVRDGTAGYLSPALRRGDPPRAGDDVFAVGALTYEMLAGAPPRPGGWLRRHGLPMAIARQRRRSGGNPGASIPVTWERAVARCLEPRERDRLGSVRELRLRLDLGEGQSPGSAATGAPAGTPASVPPVREDASPPVTSAPAPAAAIPAPPAPPVTPPPAEASRPARPPLRGGAASVAAPVPARRAPEPLPAGVPGTFWLRSLLLVVVLGMIATAIGFGWKLLERRENYYALLSAVETLPAGASAEERAALESRLLLARPELSPEQWQEVRATWEGRQWMTPPPPPPEPEPEPEPAPTPEPESAPPPVGTLVVTSTPAGAVVRLPGRPPQPTPFRLRDLPPGEYVLAVSAPGYAPVTEMVKITADAVADVRVPLERLRGSLQIESNPPGLEFSVQNVLGNEASAEGVTPAEIELPTGRYVVRLPGAATSQRSVLVDVTSDQPAIVRAEAPPPLPPERTPEPEVATTPRVEEPPVVAAETEPSTGKVSPPTEPPAGPVTAAPPPETTVTSAENTPPSEAPSPAEVSPPTTEPEPVPRPAAETAAPPPAATPPDGGIFELGDVDELPLPMVRVNPELPRRWGGPSGPARIDLIVVIDRQGRVASAVVHTSTHDSLVEPVLRAVRRWRFRPARIGGEAVPVRVSLPLNIPRP